MRPWPCLALVATLLVGGCFVSDEPLIQSRDYVYPLPDRASGDAFKWNDEQSQWTYANHFSLARDGAEYVLQEPGDDDKLGEVHVVFAAIGSNRWLVQENPDKDSSQYYYGLVERDSQGHFFVYYLTDLCDLVPKQSGLNIRIDDSTPSVDCYAGSIADVAAAIDRYLPNGTRPDRAYVMR